MRILVFYGWDIRNWGGAEHSVLGLMEALTESGHAVGLANMCWEPNLESDSPPLGLPYWGLPPVEVPYWGVPKSAIRDTTCAWRSVLRATWQFQMALRAFRPDVVSVQAPVEQCPVVVLSSRVPRRWRLTVTVRGSDIRAVPLYEPKVRAWQEQLFRQADVAIAVSESLLRDLVNLYPSAVSKALVIPNSVGQWWFQTFVGSGNGNRQPYVLYAGRLHVVKGVDILLRAWSLIHQQLPGQMLRLAGDGPELESLRALSEQLGISDSVCFLGYQKQEEVAALCRGAELVVIPSRNEGLSRIALEAGACGAVCVASRVGGITEAIVDGKTGFLTEPESPPALAGAMLCALRLPAEERRRFGKSASKYVAQHFSREVMLARYEDVFRSILRKPLGFETTKM